MAWTACHSQVQLKFDLSLCETPPCWCTSLPRNAPVCFTILPKNSVITISWLQRFHSGMPFLTLTTAGGGGLRLDTFNSWRVYNLPVVSELGSSLTGLVFKSCMVLTHFPHSERVEVLLQATEILASDWLSADLSLIFVIFHCKKALWIRTLTNKSPKHSIWFSCDLIFDNLAIKLDVEI